MSGLMARIYLFCIILTPLIVFSANRVHAVTIDQITTPTNNVDQTVSGQAEGAATISVTTDTGASDGTAEISEEGVWNYTISGLVEGMNGITVTAFNSEGAPISVANASIVLDSTSPTVTMSSTAANPTNGSPIPVTVTFSETVTGFTLDDIQVTNGTAGSFTGSGASYTFSVTPAANGLVAINIPAGAASDDAGNGNAAAAQLSRTYDSSAPTVTMSSTAANPTNGSPIPVTVSFSEAVTGFALEDIQVTNGTAGSLNGSGTSYTFSVTPVANGLVTIDIPAGRAVDGAGNGNASATQLTRTYDSVPPTILSATYISSTQVYITFSEPVVGANALANYSVPYLTITGATMESEVRYRLTTSLQAINATYTITASNITDPAGNSLSSGGNTASFTRSPSTNSAPSTPELNSPPIGIPNTNEVTTLTPSLVINNSTDPDQDPRSYLFEIDTINTFDSANKLTSPPLPEGPGTTTSWTIPTASPLANNTGWHWRVQATDGDRASGYMTTGSFFVNTANEAPVGHAISSPATATEVGTLTPVLTVTNATDPDRDTLTYEFEIATDSNFAQILAQTAAGIAQNQGGATSWQVPAALSDNTGYYWRSRVRDQHGLSSVEVTAQFFTNTNNDPPTPPTINAPPIGGPNSNEITSQTITLTVNNSTDADRDPLTYTFEIDTVTTFNSVNKQISPALAEGTGTTSWIPSSLTDNTVWYWRVKATDSHTSETWMLNNGQFLVNTGNDAPNVPTISSPANNGEVSSLTPLLAVTGSDVDLDPLTYEFQVFSDISLTPQTLVAGATEQGPNWPVTPPLEDNTRYYWIARAKDVHGIFSRWTEAGSFIVKNKGENIPPGIEITAPGAVEPVTNATSHTIRWNASDPDSPAYITLYYDSDGSGNDGTQIVTGISKDDPESSYIWDTTALADGAYYIYARIEDGKTAVYDYSAGPVVIDRTPPAAPAVSVAGGASLTNSPTPIWNWNPVGGSGNGSYRYKLDDPDLTTGAISTTDTTFTPQPLTEGSHTLHVQERDAAGNWSSSGSAAVVVDLTAPTAGISGTPNSPTNVTGATLAIAGTGVIAYRYLLDEGEYSGEITVSVPIELSGLAGGVHRVDVIGRDNAGNWQATPTSASWTVDLTAPVAAIGGAPANPTNIPSAVLTISGSDVVAYKYKLDDAPYSTAEIPATAQISLVSLNEGLHKVSVIGRDSAGNWQTETGATTFEWTVDQTAPVFPQVSTLSDGSFTNQVALNITGQVTDSSGLKSLSITVNSGGAVGTTDLTFSEDGRFTHTLELSNGANLITIKATDLAGNSSSTDPRTVNFDPNGPKLTIIAPADGTSTRNPLVEIRGEIDETSTVAMKVNGGDPQFASIFGNSFTLTANLEPGMNSVELTATDQTGNTNPTAVNLTITFDDQNPTLSINDPPQDMRTELAIMTLKGTVSDTLSPVTVDISKDGIPITPPPRLENGTANERTFQQTVTFTENRVYHIVVTATDEAGNTTSVQRTIIYAGPAKGDINNDQRVDILDALVALRISVGLLPQTDSDLIFGDVAPLVNGTSVSDGMIDVGDAVIILKAVVGLVKL